MLPADFTYKPTAMYAEGIFIPPSLNPEIPISDLNIVKRDTKNGIDKGYVVFTGCNDESALGSSPIGKFSVTEIQT